MNKRRLIYKETKQISLKNNILINISNVRLENIQHFKNRKCKILKVKNCVKIVFKKEPNKL